MYECASVTIWLDPTTERWLAALTAKLSLSRSAVVHRALAKLADAEGIDGEQAPPGPAQARVLERPGARRDGA